VLYLAFPDLESFIAFIVAILLFWIAMHPEDQEGIMIFIFTSVLAFIISINSDIFAAVSAMLTVLLINSIYTRMYYPFLVALFLDIAGLAYFDLAQYNSLLLAVSVAAIIAVAFSRRLKTGLLENELRKGKHPNVERNRDLFQLMAGVLVLSVLFSFSREISFFIILFAGLGLLTLGNIALMSGSKKLTGFFYSMERQNVTLGIGPIMIAGGTLFAMSLITNEPLLVVIVFTVIIGDALASLVGIRYPVRSLRYNRRKSLGGLLAMLLSSLLFAVFATGLSPWYIFLFPLVGSIVESVTLSPLDDNLTVPFSLIVLAAFLV
jgi:dolichol kinase